MNKLEVAPSAYQDLQAIWDFVAARDEVAARRLVQSITDKFNFLLSFPDSGRLRHELLVDMRSFPVGRYVVFYQASAEGIEILRVLHGSRDVPGVFDDMMEM
jgi:toxin ParE1/3/4